MVHWMVHLAIKSGHDSVCLVTEKQILTCLHQLTLSDQAQIHFWFVWLCGVEHYTALGWQPKFLRLSSQVSHARPNPTGPFCMQSESGLHFPTIDRSVSRRYPFLVICFLIVLYLLTVRYLFIRVLNFIYHNYTVLGNSQTIKSLYFAFGMHLLGTYSNLPLSQTFHLLSTRLSPLWGSLTTFTPSPPLHYTPDRLVFDRPTFLWSGLPSDSQFYLLLIIPFTRVFTNLIGSSLGTSLLCPQTPTHINLTTHLVRFVVLQRILSIHKLILNQVLTQSFSLQCSS